MAWTERAVKMEQNGAKMGPKCGQDGNQHGTVEQDRRDLDSKRHKKVGTYVPGGEVDAQRKVKVEPKCGQDGRRWGPKMWP